MYLHLGQGALVEQKNVVGIFDLDGCSKSVKTREFLSASERAGELFTVGEDIPKSFTVTADGNSKAVWLSQISAATLGRRSSFPAFE